MNTHDQLGGNLTTNETNVLLHEVFGNQIGGGGIPIHNVMTTYYMLKNRGHTIKSKELNTIIIILN